MTTVGAATVDRLFPADLTLGNGVVLAGQSLYAMKAKGTGMVQLVTVDCDVASPDDLDLIFTPDKVMGKIVVCGTVAGVVHGVKLQKAGGAGLVSVDGSSWSGDGVPAFAFTLPAVTLSYADGEKLNAYMVAARNPVASFSFGCDTVTGENRAPVVADFSSRGPNPVVPELLKPDVVAPGVNILAAWSGDASLSGQEEFDDGRRVEFNIISGTSMATPHVAGVAALIRKKQPSWTPAMIRSAIMTTAGTLDTTGRDILDNGATPPTSGRRDGGDRVATPLAAGAGHVRPDLALDPGLVYDAGERDYVDFLCTLNYTAEQVRMFMPGFGNCTRTLPGGPAGLNYPSFMVVFGNGTDVWTLMRTVTAVSEKAETYTVSYVAPERVKVTVTPTTLEFTKLNQKKSYTVEFRSLAGGNVTAGWDFGRISWESMDHIVRSPVAFQWNNN
ncbi:hypothetical protein PR202_ga29406 [Eleusine coracana subsp. coracana]|uniref:Uncharacterized protein n=1 Tax=Eleusine coracana subsp. coracana TaxID=191504 RepID=A0AAV5DM94_ELECO|nr:hypothetical protein PR202_ga29406 [Eleusine coracana subsp. coracana]